MRRAVLGVGYATRGITANVLTLLLPPPNILARDQLNPYLQAARRKEVEQWQSGAEKCRRKPLTGPTLLEMPGFA